MRTSENKTSTRFVYKGMKKGRSSYAPALPGYYFGLMITARPLRCRRCW
jgi:hypothetical protein